MVLIAAAAYAQPLGQFRWQLQPFCNVVTLNVVQSGAVYQLDGFDDQCGGAAPRAASVGTAFLNPDGTVGMGLAVVTAPSGTPLHLNASFNPVALNGTWRDSAGNTGSFVFTPGSPVPGSPRPAPRAVFPGGVSVGGATITNVGAPTTASDAANRGYVDSLAGTKADLADLNLVVPLNGAGSQTTLPAVNVSIGPTSFFTPRSGYLKLDLLVTGSVNCATTDSVLWWIELDGQPVRSSVRFSGDAAATFALPGMLPMSLTGITAGPVPEGNHAMIARGGCTSGTSSGSALGVYFNGSVTVLDAGYGSRLPVVPPLDTAPTAACVTVRGADGSDRRQCR
jgi:hypothetical protein